MSDRNLTVTRLVEDEIDGIEVTGDAFGDLLSELGVAPKVETRTVVTSSEHGDETRAYIVSVHTLPGTDGTTQIYACTCPGFKFHQLLSHADEIRADPEGGFEALGRCKHGDAVAVADRTTEDREASQQGFDAFADDGGATTPDAADDPGHGRPGGVDDSDTGAAYLDEPPEHASLCDDCGERGAPHHVRCPVDEDLRLNLCEECYDERGPGIEVCHVQRDSDWEVNGGRASPTIEGCEKHHLNNTAFPAPGWLGNPHSMEEDSNVERWRVLKAYREDLLRKVREEGFFAYHLGKLRGKRVACWCRSGSEDWPGEGDPCHLDVVNAALLGLYREE